MVYTPTIGEITGGRVDPELAKGQPAVVLDISQGLKYANDAAHAKAQMDWEKYKLFQKNLTENIKNINLDYTGVRPGDSNELRDAAAQFYAKLAENPAVLGNPAKYAKQYGELQNTLQGLQTKIAKSKQLEAYATAQEMFREKHPNLINDKNNKILDEWRKTPLDQASTFQWDLPKTIDYGKLAESAKKIIGVPTKVSIERVNDPITGQYTGSLQRIEGGVDYPLEKYQDLGKKYYYSNLRTDEYGHTPKQAVDDTYSLLPESAKKFFKNKADKNGTTPEEEHFMDSWMAEYSPKGGKEVSSLFKDEAFIEGGKLNHDFILEKARAKDARALEYLKESVKLEFKDKEDKEKADALIRFASATLQDAIKNGKKEQGVETGTKYINLNLPPLILEKFATPGKTVTKEGLGGTTTETEPNHFPDEVDYLPESKKFRIIHYERDVTGKVKMRDGVPRIDNNLTKTIGQSGFLTSAASAIYDKKESPKSFSLADELLKGKNLEDYEPSDKPTSDGAKPQVYNIKGIQISRSKLEEGAKKYGMSPEEYLKAIQE